MSACQPEVPEPEVPEPEVHEPAAELPVPHPDGDAFAVALERCAAALDELLAVELPALGDEQVEDALRRFEAERRRATAVRHHLVAELVHRAMPRHRQCPSTGTYLRSLVRVSAGEGRAWGRDALDLTPRRSMTTGDQLPAHRPATAAAVAAGAISTAHVRVITDVLRRVPATVDPELVARAEVTLVRCARTADPQSVHRRAAGILDALDPDGSLGSEPEHRARIRSFVLGTQNRDGMVPVRGLLEPEIGALLRAALSPLAAPQPTPDAPDLRTAGQRGHDALGTLAHRALASGELPVRHGIVATVLLTLTLDQLETRTGVTTTAHGDRLEVRDLLRLAADTGVIPAVLDSDAQILHFGAEQRLATTAQRHALYLLDRGCTFPGCTTPAPWCQAAHTGSGYATTRTTTTDELALLCGYHHRVADTQGWHLQRRHGRVWITPPTWIDPDQAPRTNEHFTPLRI